MTKASSKDFNFIAPKKVTTDKVLFIKLGRQGEWESDCIKKTNTLRLGFNDIDFQTCLNGDWKKVKNDYLKSHKNKSKSLASGFVTQIKYFFEEPEDTIWITFFENKLWWTKAKITINLEEDKTKTRPCLSKWSDKDIKGKPLFLENISGNLLKTRGFRGTICAVKLKDYLLRKINAEDSEEIKSTKKSYENLKRDLCKLIKKLTWQDFEILIDLIFTQAGWKRVSVVGKTIKTIDLDLKSPVTNEKCLVQIKSSSNNDELSEYLKKFISMTQYHKFYYVCHTFRGKPQNINDNRIRLLLTEEISGLAIDSGLSQWIISKVS